MPKKKVNPKESKPTCLRCRKADPVEEVVLKTEYDPCSLCKPCQLSLLRQRMIDLHIPKRFLKSTLKNFDIPANHPHRNEIKLAATVIREYAREFHPHKATNLLLYGTVGTGKTHLAWGILKYIAINHNLMGQYRIFGELMEDIRFGFNNKDRAQEKELVTDLCHCVLLVLDEVGSDTDTDYEMKIVQNILSKRYNLGLPTIVITNKNESEFLQIFSERALDRLLSDGNLRIPFAWPSYRTNRWRT